MAEDGKASRLEHVVVWVRRWGRFARVGRAAARHPLGRRVGAVVLIPVVLLGLVILGIVRVLGG